VDSPSPPRLWLQAPFFTWAALGLLRLGQILAGHARREQCPACSGTGVILSGPCPACGGAGRWWSVDSGGMDALGGLRQELWVLAGLMAILGLLVYAFTTADCRACEARGCDRCLGRGWLTTMDRWAAGRREPRVRPKPSSGAAWTSRAGRPRPRRGPAG
jgi:hypothetical protein